MNEPLRPTPGISILRHCQVPRYAHMAAMIERKAKEGPALKDNQTRFVEESELIQEFPCAFSQKSKDVVVCSTLAITRLGCQITAFGPTRALALRRMHRAYMDALESKKVVSDRMQALRIAGRSRFYVAVEV